MRFDRAPLFPVTACTMVIADCGNHGVDLLLQEHGRPGRCRVHISNIAPNYWPHQLLFGTTPSAVSEGFAFEVLLLTETAEPAMQEFAHRLREYLHAVVIPVPVMTFRFVRRSQGVVEC